MRQHKKCFKKFISRRGCPAKTLSNNGSTFTTELTQSLVNLPKIRSIIVWLLTEEVSWTLKEVFEKIYAYLFFVFLWHAVVLYTNIQTN